MKRSTPASPAPTSAWPAPQRPGRSAAWRVILVTLLLLPGWANLQAQIFNGLGYTVEAGGTITITGFDCVSSVVIIPDLIEGLPVTGIAPQAFRQCHALTSVTIGNTVIDIGPYAFSECTELNRVIIGNSVTSIGSEAFSHCFSLTSVTLPKGVTWIANGLFAYCFALSSVTIPHGVFDIGSGAFFFCTNLTSVTIPKSVTSIGYRTFAGCAGLTKVHFRGNAPGRVTDSFQEADNATLYYLPETTGWGATFGGRPTALWQPQVQSSDPSFGVQTNRFGFTVTWAADRIVVVEACTDLAHPVWSLVGTNTMTGGSAYFSDPQAADARARFYRLRGE